MDINEEKIMVFVYGTLMKGESNSHFLSNSKYIGEYKTDKRWGLINIGAFPALVPHVLAVEGEVYEISKGTLSTLDRLEGVSHGLYRRREIVVFDEDDEELIVETYLWDNVPNQDEPKFPSWRALE